jgi:hypothetical protein
MTYPLNRARVTPVFTLKPYFERVADSIIDGKFKIARLKFHRQVSARGQRVQRWKRDLAPFGT